MTRQVRRIPFDEFAADLERVLNELGSVDETILVEKSGKTFRVELELQHSPGSDIWKNYDPERAREALRRSAGALAGVDVKKLKDDIRAARGQDSIGRPGD